MEEKQKEIINEIEFVLKQTAKESLHAQEETNFTLPQFQLFFSSWLQPPPQSIPPQSTPPQPTPQSTPPQSIPPPQSTQSTPQPHVEENEHANLINRVAASVKTKQGSLPLN